MAASSSRLAENIPISNPLKLLVSSRSKYCSSVHIVYTNFHEVHVNNGLLEISYDFIPMAVTFPEVCLYLFEL